MAETQHQGFVQEIYAEVAQKIGNGVSSYRIEQSLVERGLTVEDARLIVNRIQDEKAKTHRGMATKQMLIGALIVMIGIIIAWLTYSGMFTIGAYIVAWGAILVGSWRFLLGLTMNSNK